MKFCFQKVQFGVAEIPRGVLLEGNPRASRRTLSFGAKSLDCTVKLTIFTRVHASKYQALAWEVIVRRSS